MGLFGASKYIVVPIGAFLVWSVVVRELRTNRSSEFWWLLSILYFTYPVSAILAHPDWRRALHDTLVPNVSRSSDYLIMVVGLIGTTITPWMQFYLQASVVEKGITKRQYSLCRWDVIIGCIITDVIAFFIVLACAATLHVSRLPQYFRRCRRGRRLASAGRSVRLSAVCRGTGECFATFGGHSAAGHCLQRL